MGYEISKERRRKQKISRFKRYWPLMLFLLPAIVYVFIFSYVPMYGILVAWQDYMPGDQIIGRNTLWIGWDNFRIFFGIYNFKEIFLNTFLLCLWGFIIGFPIPIIVALLLNSLKSKKFQKILQTIFYAPHFISLVVLVGIIYLFFGSNGLINNIAEALGFQKYSYFLEPASFRPLFIFSGNWQDFGWNAVIYLAALSGVDPALHEAASMDGASRLKRILHIDLPAILPTISMQLILSFGNLMSCGYEKVLLLQTNANLTTSEILSTYIYKSGILGANYGVATAAGLFNSAINIGLIIFANTIARRVSEHSIW